MSTRGSTKKQKQVLDKETVFDQFTKPCLQQRFTDIAKKLNQSDTEFNNESGPNDESGKRKATEDLKRDRNDRNDLKRSDELNH